MADNANMPETIIEDEQMKLNKTLFATITILGSLALPVSALALDARDFADKLSATLSTSSAMEINFNSAVADGDTITLSDWSIPAAEGRAKDMLNTPIIFIGVSETSDGGYTAKSATFDDIDYTDDGINIKLNNIVVSDIFISAEPSENLLDTMMFYRGLSAGPFVVSAEESEVFKIDRFSATNNSNADQTELIEDLKAQRCLYSEVCRTLQGLVAKLNQIYDEIFIGHKEEIAKLSVEIARKILMQKVQDGDYEIESIVKETLKNAPTRQDLVVHLNPEDMADCQKVQQEDNCGTLAGIKLVADANIGRAECVLESPKGIIRSLIDEHLKQIGKALKKTE